MNNIDDKILDFEDGVMEECELIPFFQELINSGKVWDMESRYQKTAEALIQGNLCQMPSQVEE